MLIPQDSVPCIRHPRFPHILESEAIFIGATNLMTLVTAVYKLMNIHDLHWICDGIILAWDRRLTLAQGAWWPPLPWQALVLFIGQRMELETWVKPYTLTHWTSTIWCSISILGTPGDINWLLRENPLSSSNLLDNNYSDLIMVWKFWARNLISFRLNLWWWYYFLFTIFSI